MSTRQGMHWGAIVSAVALICSAAIMAGCASTGQGASRDQLTANVGNYSPPPNNVEKPRVAVPPFGVDNTQARFDFSSDRLEGMAADQLTTLLHQTNRFSVIERAQLGQLLDEQSLEGIVQAGELTQPGQVRGVDYLLLGKITGFRITAEETNREVGVSRGWVADQLGGVTGGVDQSQTILTTEMGVDLRLVDPATGEVKSAQFTQFRQEDTADSFGIDVAGVGGSGDANVRISEDDAGRVMRLAFDDVVRKMLPEIDSGILVAADSGTGDVDTAAQNQSRPSFCPACGESLAADASFCGSCGEPIN